MFDAKRKPLAAATPAWLAALVLAICLGTSGCTSIIQPIESIPAHRVPSMFLAEPQASKEPIDFTRLRRSAPDEYLLGPGDLLAVFIEGVLGALDESPPVQVPQEGSDLPPAIGYPVPVREDGTVSLPLIRPVPVEGLTLAQAEELIYNIYTGQTPEQGKVILQEDNRFVVTLMKERTHRVIVIRQDNPIPSSNFSGFSERLQSTRTDFSSRGYVLDLPAYKNDVLHALAQTGGLPGVHAKAEVTILRGDEERWRAREALIMDWIRRYGNNQDPCFVPPPIPDDPNALRIPLRTYPGVIPDIDEEDIILEEGDVVLVESRETEVFYTGGLLPGGEHQLPRDYDLDVLGAIAVAGGRLASTGGGGGSALVPSGGGVAPTQLIVLRKLPGGGQIAIEVDLIRAINDPRSRLLVKAGDTLILRYKPEEELLNFGVGTFFTYGIRELFRD